ncbi:MAG: efflux RND transporter periplasmic adaptor subunit [Tepidisphaeraceae bacterium]
MKTLVTILVTAVVVGAAGVGITLKLRGGASQDATPVRMDPATRGSLSETVSAPGQVMPKTKVSISARTAARVIELPFVEGQVVTSGALLVRLDAKDFEALLRGAQARYAAQQAQLKVAEERISAQELRIAASRVLLADAQRDLKRQNELLSSKDVSQSVVDSAQAKFDQLKNHFDSEAKSVEADRSNLLVMKHEMDALDADIARARDTLSYTIITSPIDGIVTKLNAQVGELVVTGTMNNPGTVIMEVADLSRMLVYARIDESSIAGVQVGQKAHVRSQAFPNQVFDGTVQTVALAHTEEKDGSRYYKVEVLLDTNGKRIPSGLTADVDIETQRHENVLKVPSQSVLGRPVDELPQAMRNAPEVDSRKTLVPVVYKMVDGKAIVTPVAVGPSDVTHTVITSGLKEGDIVITGPYKVLEKLANEQKVTDEKTVTTKPA